MSKYKIDLLKRQIDNTLLAVDARLDALWSYRKIMDSIEQSELDDYNKDKPEECHKKIQEFDFIDIISRYEQFPYIFHRNDIDDANIDFMIALIKHRDVPSFWRYSLVMSFYQNGYLDIVPDLIESVVDSGSMDLIHSYDLIMILLCDEISVDIAHRTILKAVKNGPDSMGAVKNCWYRLINLLIRNDTIRLSGTGGEYYPIQSQEFLSNLIEAYMMNTDNDLRLRMQCSGMLLYSDGSNTVATKFLEDTIENHYENENIVGDAFDILIQRHADSKKYEKMVIDYGNRNNTFGGFADNTQNAHMFYNQAISLLNLLSSKHPKTELERRFQSFEDRVCSIMVTKNVPDDKQQSVYMTLERFHLDMSKIGGKEISLRQLGGLIDMYIHDNDEMMLIEEMVDMSGTCTSGHFIRLLNIIAKDTEYAFTISYDTQFKSNVSGRLQATMRNMSDEDSDIVITELAEDVKSEKYKTIMAPIMAKIQDDLFDEFVVGGYISKLQFDKFWDSHGVPFC